MKKYLLVLIAVLVVTMAGCSVMYDADDIETTVSFSVSNSITLQEKQTTYKTTTTAKTTEKETTSTTNSVVATSKVETTANPTTNNQTTTKSTTTTTTTKPTTEKKVTQSQSTTKHTTTTKKVTTTQKQTTTKPKTTKAPYFCDEGGTHHSCRVGPIGWVSSYQKATDAALKYIADHDTSGNFTVEECWYCGKYTASVILD